MTWDNALRSLVGFRLNNDHWHGFKYLLIAGILAVLIFGFEGGMA